MAASVDSASQANSVAVRGHAAMLRHYSGAMARYLQPRFEEYYFNDSELYQIAIMICIFILDETAAKLVLREHI